MASIARDPGGRKRIQWLEAGKRRTLRLGVCSVRDAETVRLRVEALLVQRITGRLDVETARWLMEVDDAFHAKLVHLGLAAPKVRTGGGGAAVPTVGFLLERYFATLTVKGSTLTTYTQTRTALEESEHFGKGLPLAALGGVVCGDERARLWRRAMVDDGLAQATISKRVKTARQIFRMAVKWRLLAENPFADVRAGTQANPKRGFFVERWVVEKLLELAPDPEWKCIIALPRYGGLRCPSELLTLRWVDLFWDQGRMRVWSSKTEGHEGGEFRIVPIYPELRPVLLGALEYAVDGSVYVIERTRSDRVNWRSRLMDLIARAGASPWPRLFQNMRASRQTELEDQFPGHVVCAWMGNSQVVARRHYLQLRDRHFEQALGGDEGAAQNAAQSALATGGQGATPAAESPRPVAESPSVGSGGHWSPEEEVTPTGSVGVPREREKQNGSGRRGARGGARPV